MPYVKFDTPTDANKTSPQGFLNYMEKEDREKGIDKEFWFNERDDYVPAYRIAEDIENQKGLGVNDFRYYTGSISFSQEELSFLNNDTRKLKEFGKRFITVYANNYNKGLTASDVRFYLKLESDRYFKGSDSEVIAGKVKSGDKKPGTNTHFHFIVGRKSVDETKKLSPLSNHINTEKGAVTGGFSRDSLKERTEHLFDNMYSYNRPLEQTYRYANNVSPGKDVKQRMLSIQQSTDKAQSHLKYSYLSHEDKVKKLSVLMNYMQHGNDRKNDLAIMIDQKEILSEAEKRNYNGDIYKALLNMNYRLKNGFQPKQDLTPFILEYARFVGAPYSKLPDSLKKDRFLRFGQIINDKLSDDKKLDIEKLFRVEQQNQLNGKVYRALGEFNKLLAIKESIGDVNDTIIALSKKNQINTTETNGFNRQSQTDSTIDIVSSFIKDVSMASIKDSNSGSAYREEQKPKKRKKNNNRPKL